MGRALGDVRARQPGDHPRRVGELHGLLDGLDRAEQVAVAELDALRGAGRPRGVDQGEHILRAERGDRCLDVEVRLRLLDLGERGHALRRFTIDHDDVREVGELLARLEHAGEELLLADEDLRARVGDHELDLLGRVLHVDRERHAAGHRHREIAERELGPVADEQRAGVALREAQTG